MKTLFSSLSIVFFLALRNIFRNKRRTFVTLLSVILGVSSTLILAGIARGMAQQIIDDSIYSLVGHIKIQHIRFHHDPSIAHTIYADEHQLSSLRAIPEVKAVLPRIRIHAVLQSERDAAPITLIGEYPERERDFSLGGSLATRGNSLEGAQDSKIMLGESILPTLKSEIGKRIVILTQGAKGDIASKGFRITGTYQAEVRNTEKQFAFTGIEPLRELLELSQGQYHEISIILEDESMIEGILPHLRQLFPNADVRSWETLEPLVVSMSKLQNGFLIIWFVIVVITVSFGTINALLMSIFERVREIAIVNALGMTSRWIIIETILQAFFLLLSGGTVGILLGITVLEGFLSEGISVKQFAEGTSIVGIGDRILPLLHTSDALTILILLTVIGTLGCLYPAWLATRIKPSVALKKF